jgi:hypothetical protein
MLSTNTDLTVFPPGRENAAVGLNTNEFREKVSAISSYPTYRTLPEYSNEPV